MTAQNKNSLSFSKKAAHELEELKTWLANNESQHRAEKVVRSIITAAELAAGNPLMYPQDPHFSRGNETIRRMVVGNTRMVTYRVFYGGIQIMRIIHGSRDIQ